ncbi:hypothetical protein D3C73_808100 [compost metagenome]
MQGNQPGPIRSCVQERLIPDLRLRTGVGEQQAAGTRFNFGHDLGQHFQTHVAGPGEALDGGRQQGVDLQRLAALALDAHPAALWDQYLFGVGLVAERRGNTPYDQLRIPPPQAGEGQLQLHAALVAEQFVPLVHHDHAQGR